MALTNLMNEVYLAYIGVAAGATATFEHNPGEIVSIKDTKPLFADVKPAQLPKRISRQAILETDDNALPASLPKASAGSSAMPVLPAVSSNDDLIKFESPKPSGELQSSLAFNAQGLPMLLPTCYSPSKAVRMKIDPPKVNEAAHTIRTLASLPHPALPPTLPSPSKGDPTKIDPSNTTSKFEAVPKVNSNEQSILLPTVSSPPKTDSPESKVKKVQAESKYLKTLAAMRIENERVRLVITSAAEELKNALERSRQMPLGSPHHISQLIRQPDVSKPTQNRSSSSTKQTNGSRDLYLDKPLPPIPLNETPVDAGQAKMTLQERIERYFDSMTGLENVFLDDDLDEASDALSMQNYPKMLRTSASSDSINTNELYLVVKRGHLHKLRRLVKQGRAVPNRVLEKRISALDRLEGRKTKDLDRVMWPARPEDTPILPWMSDSDSDSSSDDSDSDSDSDSGVTIKAAAPVKVHTPVKVASPGMLNNFLVKAGHKMAPNRFQARPIDNPEYAAAKAAAILGLAESAKARKGIATMIGIKKQS
jgi:hypothetical protein